MLSASCTSTVPPFFAQYAQDVQRPVNQLNGFSHATLQPLLLPHHFNFPLELDLTILATASTMETHNQQRPPPKTAGLPNILNDDHGPASGPNPPPHLRDSGFYSNADASSKRMPLIDISGLRVG